MKNSHFITGSEVKLLEKTCILQKYYLKPITVYQIPIVDKNGVFTGRIFEVKEGSIMYKKFMDTAGKIPNNIQILSDDNRN